MISRPEKTTPGPTSESRLDQYIDPGERPGSARAQDVLWAFSIITMAGVDHGADGNGDCRQGS